MKTYGTYTISAVKYDGEETRIEQAMVHLEPGHVLIGKRSREWIVERLLAGSKFLTAMREDEIWHVVDEVKPVEVAGGVFLRVDSRRDDDDDLGEVPKL
jgi:hypothetical protein